MSEVKKIVTEVSGDPRLVLPCTFPQDAQELATIVLARMIHARLVLGQARSWRAPSRLPRQLDALEHLAGSRSLVHYAFDVDGCRVLRSVITALRMSIENESEPALLEAIEHADTAVEFFRGQVNKAIEAGGEL